MTSTRKAVTRITEDQYRTIFSQPREVVVTIAPGDILVFREKGRRASWSLAIDSAFRYAVRLQALKDAAEKARNKPKRKRR